jgi:N-acetylmuramoyl-L-alanine amidase
MRLTALRWIQKGFLAVIVAVLLALGWTAWQQAHGSAGSARVLPSLAPNQTPPIKRIGIVAGHSGYNQGASCADGLTEVEVVQAVAEAVVRDLRQRGAAADLLQEFDDRLAGYQADAFVSIHADSCDVDFTGFKVASLEGGSDASAQLATCLWDRYEEATGLPRHLDTITDDMRFYHAFREISPDTPAAIIETGFLGTDRELLAGHPDLVATAIVDGIECFLMTPK